ncbi:hypothetical protein C0993_009038 [Termitomyces sp. T159_Od127]|nr:hypothetical protein C0993_009038 [Termitomyces sp. T159_Od127]
MPAHVVNVIEPSPSKQPPPSKKPQSPQPPPAPLRPRAKINSSAQPRVRPEPRAALRPASVRIKARVAPAALRSPPPASPPTSTPSFSSRSSLSAADDLRPAPAPRSPAPDPDLKASAKSNRKIADLEITNRSLLAINASLESTKHTQAREIRDLRRKLRESRLILPPPAFRAVNDADPTDDSDSDDDDDEDEDDAAQDEVFVRIKTMLDNLLETGRAALQTQPRESAAKVLSADEVRSWTEEDGPDIHAQNGSDSEDEVERTLLHSATPTPPPIRISSSGQYT